MEDTTWYGGRFRPRRRCVRWGPSSSLTKRGAVPPLFGPLCSGTVVHLSCYEIWMHQCYIWFCGRPDRNRRQISMRIKLIEILDIQKWLDRCFTPASIDTRSWVELSSGLLRLPSCSHPVGTFSMWSVRNIYSIVLDEKFCFGYY